MQGEEEELRPREGGGGKGEKERRMRREGGGKKYEEGIGGKE